MRACRRRLPGEAVIDWDLFHLIFWTDESSDGAGREGAAAKGDWLVLWEGRAFPPTTRLRETAFPPTTATSSENGVPTINWQITSPYEVTSTEKALHLDPSTPTPNSYSNLEPLTTTPTLNYNLNTLPLASPPHHRAYHCREPLVAGVDTLAGTRWQSSFFWKEWRQKERLWKRNWFISITLSLYGRN